MRHLRIIIAILVYSSSTIAHSDEIDPATEPTVTETRLADGTTELNVIEPSGDTVATYKIDLSKHYYPATSVDDPLIKRWKSWRYGAFLCYNSNQYSGREFCLTKDPTTFAPTDLDVDQWIDTFKAAGMKFAVLTARHTSGFLMWDSATSRLDVAESPCKVDVVRKYVEACRKADIAPGIYYCLWGGRGCSVTGRREVPGAREKILAQLYELATHYGKIPYFWIDMGCWMPANLKPREVYDMLKAINPETIVIFNQHIQDGRQLRYFPTDVVNGELRMPPAAGHDPMREVDGIKYYLPFEYEPCSQGAGETNVAQGVFAAPRWFTYGDGRDFAASRSYPPSYLAMLIRTARSRGTSNVLLSCAPDYTGRMRKEDVDRLIELRKLLDTPAPVSERCKAEASGVWSEGDYRAALAFDGLPHTRWGGAEGTTSGWLTVDLKRPTTIRRLWISEGWDRVRRFELQVEEKGEWRTIFSGDKIGADYTARFDPIEARKFRINFLEATDVPTIWEVQLFER